MRPEKTSIVLGNQSKVTVRILLTLVMVLMTTSCAKVVPGLDRIFFSNSSAKVGPLVTVNDEQTIAQGDDSLKDGNTGDGPSDETDFTSNLGEPDGSPSPEMAATSNDVTDRQATPAESEIQTNDPKNVTPNTSNAEKLPNLTATVNKPKTVEKSLGTPTTAKPRLNPVNKVAPKPVDIPVEYGAVEGRVVLLGADKQTLPATGTLITLVPKGIGRATSERPSEVHIIDMENKTYQPRYSTIQAGDQVVFVNKDNIRHNVFSSSGANAFDLGTYGAGLKRAVTLKEPGIVKIYCNIHAEMATFVAVGDQGLSVKVDDNGGYKLRDILPGHYEATIWNIRGQIKRDVVVSANKTLKLIDQIDTTAFQSESRTNKFGGEYSKNATLFEDEFY